MTQSVINNVIKSVALLGTMLACQSVFAGVGIYMDVTNNTENQLLIPICHNAPCAYDGTETYYGSRILSPTQTETNVVYREAPNNSSYTSYTASIPVYVNENNVNVNICNVIFTGETYSYGLNGVPPRMRGEAVKITYNNQIAEPKYACKATVKKDEGIKGDTENISVSIIPIIWTCPTVENLRSDFTGNLTATNDSVISMFPDFSNPNPIRYADVSLDWSRFDGIELEKNYVECRYQLFNKDGFPSDNLYLKSVMGSEIPQNWHLVPDMGQSNAGGRFCHTFDKTKNPSRTCVIEANQH